MGIFRADAGRVVLRMPGLLSWRDAQLIALPLCLFYAFVCLTPWYMCRQLPLRPGHWFVTGVNHFGAAILASAIWVELARLMAYFLNAREQLHREIPLSGGGRAAALFAFGSFALHAAGGAASREAQVQAREAELRALKAQINPHFLFNSLNSITALIATDPARAREMCIRRSEFLATRWGWASGRAFPGGKRSSSRALISTSSRSVTACVCELK